MSADSVLFVACLLVGLGIAIVYFTVTEPEKIRRARMLGARQEIKLARQIPGGSALTPMFMDLGDALARLWGIEDTEDEDTARGQALVQQLKAANWYWEAQTGYPPTPDAPFWDVPTYWTNKGGYTLVYSAVGLALAGFIGWQLQMPQLALIGLLLGAFLGFGEPDKLLTNAARNRQDVLTIELGVGASKLYALLHTKGGIEAGIRALVADPGGPFIEELKRVMALYDMTHSLGKGLTEMLSRNTNQGIREFCTAMKMAVERRGGDLGAALEIQSVQAREQMKRYVEQRSLGNENHVSGLTTLCMFLLTLLIFILPIIVVVANAISGGA